MIGIVPYFALRAESVPVQILQEPQAMPQILDNGKVPSVRAHGHNVRIHHVLCALHNAAMATHWQLVYVVRAIWILLAFPGSTS